MPCSAACGRYDVKQLDDEENSFVDACMKKYNTNFKKMARQMMQRS